ncbi:NAD(P)-binding protein [Hymenopellis radicata]|nr:NAD(P)-binding protein [Hymenopellis radicata]
MSLPSTVEAITIAKTGDFDVIEKTTSPFPKVDPDHIVLKARNYFGVNFIDTYFRKGLYPIKDFPAVLGQEVSGTIVALPTDEEVVNDPDYKARKYSVGSKVTGNVMGVHASYASIPWKKVSVIPDAIGTKVGVAACVQAMTAITFMTEAYNVSQGDVVLIHTVAGGLGLHLTQYAKYRGATVIGTTSSKEKAEVAKAHGADHVILYTSENTVDRVLELTNGEGVHAIFDGVGKDTFENNFKIIKRKGTLVSIGNASGAVPPFSPLQLMPKNVKLVRPNVGNYAFTPSEILHYTTEMYELIGRGILKINIYKEYPFTAEGVQQAQKDLVGGKTIGKLVVNVNIS